MDYRVQNPELDDWFVDVKDYISAEDRGSRKTDITVWEELAETTEEIEERLKKFREEY